MTKPVSSAPTHGPQQKAAAHPQLPPKGMAFANILAEAFKPAPKPQIMTGTGQAPKPQTTALPQAVLAVHAEPEKRNRHGHGDGDLDPVARQAALLAPPQTMTITSASRESTAAQTNARVSLEELVPQLVKKIAWSGDAQRGMVRMELGAGDLAGGTLTVSAENGRVSVHIAAPPGTDANEWKSRIANRLEARGIAVDTVHVE
jgi:hypothetical protein